MKCHLLSHAGWGGGTTLRFTRTHSHQNNCRGYLTVLLPYGHTWRALRRISHHFLHEAASLQYRDAQARTNLVFLRAILHQPQDFMKHVRNLTASSIFELAYGIELQGDDDPWVSLVNHAVEVMTTAVVFGSYAVDWLPIRTYACAQYPNYASSQRQ